MSSDWGKFPMGNPGGDKADNTQNDEQHAPSILHGFLPDSDEVSNPDYRQQQRSRRFYAPDVAPNSQKICA